MTSAESPPPASALERRLRDALRGTSLETPRPVTTLQLPMPPALDEIVTATLRAGLRPSAVLVPVIRRGRELSVLMTVRSANLREHSGQIAFPGGAKDAADVTAVDNALREAQEEVGLDPHRVEILGYLDDCMTLSRFLVTPVVGLIDGTPELQIDTREVAELFELPLAFAADPRNFERKLLERDGFEVPFYELNWQQYRVWGATAGMLWDLAQRLADG